MTDSRYDVKKMCKLKSKCVIILRYDTHAKLVKIMRDNCIPHIMGAFEAY